MKNLFKKIALVTLVLCMTIAVLTVAAMAAETSGGPVATDGKATFTWSYDASTKTLTIGGSDPDWSWNTKYLAADDTYKAFAEAYGSEVETLVIADISTKIGGPISILGVPNITTFKTEKVTRWQGENFFGGMPNLKIVSLAGKTSDCVDLSNAGTLGGEGQVKNLFKDCTSIEKVILPTGGIAVNEGILTYIPEGMFSGCTSLKTVKLPAGTTEIKSNAFANTAITEIHIPAGVTTIADDAFTGTSLTKITGSKGSAAETFATTKGITFEEYDASTTPAEIESGCGIYWSYNPETKTLTFTGTGATLNGLCSWDASWHVVDESPWSSYKSEIKHVRAEKCTGLKTLSGMTFAEMTALEDIVLPETVTSFGGNAIFIGCTNLNAIAYGSADKIVENYLDIHTVTSGLNGETFESACVGKTLTMKLAKNIEFTNCFKSSMPTKVTFEVVKGGTAESKVNYYKSLGTAGYDIEVTYYTPEVTWSRVNTQTGTEDLLWSFDEDTGTLTIKSTTTTVLNVYDSEGNVANWDDYTNAPWSAYYKSLKKIVVTGAITEIGSYALAGGHGTCETIILSDKITKLGTNCFAYHDKLSSVAYSEADVKENYADIHYSTFNQYVFETSFKNKSITVWVSADSNITTNTFSGSNLTSAHFILVKGSTSETSLDKVSSSVAGTVTKEYYTLSWAEYCKLNPMPADLVTSGSFTNTYTDQDWSFDKTTGVLTITEKQASGWTEYTFSSEDTTFANAFAKFKKYVTEIKLVLAEGAIANKIQASFDFSGMVYLEKFTWEGSVGQFYVTPNGFNNCSSLKTFGPAAKVTEGTLYLDNNFNNGVSFNGCSSFSKIVVTGNTQSATNVSSDKFASIPATVTVTYTSDADNASKALNGIFESTRQINVNDATVKTAVEALGYTTVKCPAAVNKTGMTFVGYQTRVTEKNGLRSLFSFDLTATNEGMTLVEFGAITAAASKQATVDAATLNGDGSLAVSATGVVVSTVWKDGAIKSNYLTNDGSTLTFCVSVVNFTNNYDSDLYNVGYEIWKDNETGSYTLKLTSYSASNPSSTYDDSVSIYDLTLDGIKEGVSDAKNTINWGVLTGKGAVKFTRANGDYDDTWKNLLDSKEDGSYGTFGDSFEFLNVQLASATTGSTATYGYVSVFEDSNGDYVAIYKANGDNNVVPNQQGWSGQYTHLQTNGKWFNDNGVAPNPKIDNSKLWNKIKTIVVADKMTTQAYAFEAIAATQFVYAEGMTMGERIFCNSKSLSTVFPIADMTGSEVKSNKEVGVADLSKATVNNMNENFADCEKIVYLRLPATFNSVGDKAFKDMASLKALVVGDGEFVDGVMDFSALDSLAIKDTGTDRVFQGSTGNNITTIKLPDNTTIATADNDGSIYLSGVTIQTASNIPAIYDYVHTTLASMNMKYTDFDGTEWGMPTEDHVLRAEGWSTIVVA